MVNYTYDGYMPWGVAEMHYLSCYIVNGFSGNAVEQIIKEGIGVWKPVSDKFAHLRMRSGTDLFFVKR